LLPLWRSLVVLCLSLGLALVWMPMEVQS
jgi:hypothetical protein